MFKSKWTILAILTAAALAIATSRLAAQKKPTTAPAPAAWKKGGVCPHCARLGQAGAATKLSKATQAIDQAVKAVEAGDKKAALAALGRAKKLIGAVSRATAKPAKPKVCPAGCNCPTCAAARAKAGKPAAKFANVRCPMMGGAIDLAKVPAGLTRQFRGKKVAFCCAGCPVAWDKLTDADKQAKLDKVRAK